MSEIDILLNHNDNYRKMKEEELAKAREKMEKDRKTKGKSYKNKHIY